MICKWTKEEWTKYLENRCSTSQQNKMEQHLLNCPACLLILEEVIQQQIPSLEQEMGAAPDVSSAVMRSIQADHAQPQGGKKVLISFVHYSIAASIAFLLFQIGIFDAILAADQSGFVFTEHTQSMLGEVFHQPEIWLDSFAKFLKIN